MNLKFFHCTLKAFQLDFLLAAFANLRFIKTESVFGMVNFALSVICVSVYLGLILLTISKSRRIDALNEYGFENLNKIELAELEDLTNWKFTKTEINPHLRNGWRLFNELLMLKEMAISFFIVMFIENALL